MSTTPPYHASPSWHHHTRHPGCLPPPPPGLLDEAGGQRQLLLGVDDQLGSKLHGAADKPYRWRGWRGGACLPGAWGRARGRLDHVRHACIDVLGAGPGREAVTPVPHAWTCTHARMLMPSAMCVCVCVRRTVPRADVAELCAQCLALPQARNRAFDVTSVPPGARAGVWAGGGGGRACTCVHERKTR